MLGIPSKASAGAEFTANRLQARYVVALSLIALLTIVSQWVLQRSLANQEFDSRVVNIAGRQRMLSQKITKAGLYLRTAETGPQDRQARDQLRDALALWQRSHLGLQYGDPAAGLPGHNSIEVDQLFKAVEPDYQAMVAAAATILIEPAGSPGLADAVRQLREHEPSFLAGMDAIVFRYDSEAKQKVARARRLELGLGGLTLAVLAIEAGLIFAPAVRRMRDDASRHRIHQADLERLFSASPTAMFVIDEATLTIARGNRKAASLMGRPERDYLGKPLGSFLDTASEANRAFLDKLRAGDTFDEFEVALIDDRGRVTEALASACPIRYADRTSLAVGLTNIAEVKKAQQALEHYATFDEMTGMVNRRTGLLMLATEFGRAARDRLPLSVCFVDLDALKAINDRFGHREGDWMIKALARAFLDSIRSGDVAIRLGGDEFLLVLHDCTGPQAELLIGRIEDRLRHEVAAEKRAYPVSASFGLAVYDPARHASPEQLVAEADNRMYRAKQAKKASPGGIEAA